MFKLVFCIVGICLFIFSITFRFIVLNLFTVVRTGISDIYYYFKHKKYNECKWYGKLYMFTAQDSQAFGCGKSLSFPYITQAIGLCVIYCYYLFLRSRKRLLSLTT